MKNSLSGKWEEKNSKDKGRNKWIRKQKHSEISKYIQELMLFLNTQLSTLTSGKSIWEIKERKEKIIGMRKGTWQQIDILKEECMHSKLQLENLN